MKPTTRAIIFDWAGTTIDHGSRAPAKVFVEVFAAFGIPITDAEARGPMGQAKWDHIASILSLPRVSQRWKERYGRPWNDSDVRQMYADFLPRQKEVIAEYAVVIPGVAEVLTQCRQRGIKTAGTTGYTRELMDVVEPLARAGGYAPDASFCADDVPAGRPAPWMIFRACEKLNVYPMSEVLVVDDTPVGITAGKNAGARTVAVTRTGNGLGLSLEEVEALPRNELTERLHRLEADFRRCGADHVIESVADLFSVIGA